MHLLKPSREREKNNHITLDLGMPDKIQDAQLLYKFQINNR